MRKKNVFLLGSLQAFTALGAIPAGLSMILEPDGSGLGLPLETLQGSPFSDFLIPGILLLIMNGVLQALGAVLSFAKNTQAGRGGVFLGILLTAWICIQVYFIGLITFLQPLFFFIGVAEIFLGLRLIKV